MSQVTWCPPCDRGGHKIPGCCERVSDCHGYEVSQWTTRPVDVPFGSKCSVDVPSRHHSGIGITFLYIAMQVDCHTETEWNIGKNVTFQEKEGGCLVPRNKKTIPVRCGRKILSYRLQLAECHRDPKNSADKKKLGGRSGGGQNVARIFLGQMFCQGVAVSTYYYY
jgi:hypothetical protein